MVESRCAKVFAGAGSVEIVRRDVDRLEGGDRAVLGRGDPFLELAHFRGKRGLVADGARSASEQGGDFRAGLGKAEDVVDEEEHVLVLFVAEILGHGERAQGHAHAGAGRLVHLAVDQGHLRFGEVLLVDDSRLGHFMVEIVALAGALADAGENGVTAVALGDVVDEFHDDDGLADPRAAERADLAALGEGADQVDDFDARFEDFGAGVLIKQRRRRAMNGIAFGEGHRAALVGGVAQDVEDAAQHAFAHGDGNGGAGVVDFVAALEAFRERHGHGANPAFAQMLLDFEGEPGRLASQGVVNGEGVEERGQVAVGEFDIDDRPDDLNDFTDVGGGSGGGNHGEFLMI